MFPLPFLVDLLSRLPALEHLTIGQLRLGSEYCDIINSDSETVPRQGSFPQSLLTLNLRVSRGSGFFFAWLLSLPELPVPRSLELALLLKEEDLPFEEYLRRAGSELESFSLSVDSWFVEHSNLERRWLSYATKLSTLTFAPSQGALTVPEILGSLSSPRLSGLTIVLRDNEVVPWGAMDQALSHPKFESLQRFTVEDAEAGRKEHVCMLDEGARAAIPLTSARGILYSRFSAPDSGSVTLRTRAMFSRLI